MMRRLITTLASLCLLLSMTSINVYASLITETLSADYQIDNNGFRIYPQFSSTGIYITSTSLISSDDYARFYWEFDSTSLTSISFDMTLLGNENNFALATFFVGEQTLWSQAETVTELTNITLDFSQYDFSTLSSDTVKLGFKLQAQHINGDYVRVNRQDKSSLQLSDIELTRTNIPEPSSLVLLLSAMGVITRKQLLKLQ